MTLDELQTWLGDANVKAFLRVIRQGETNQEDSAYSEINGGGHFVVPPWAHPFDDIPTTQGGKAAGAYQFLGTTWARLNRQFSFADFSPINQDLAAVALIAQRQALSAVMAGGIAKAIELLKEEWISLPHLGDRAKQIFAQYGGQENIAVITKPSQASSTPEAVPEPQPTPKNVPMPILAILSAFGPILAQLIPQVAKALKPESVSAARDAQTAQTVLNAITAAAGSLPPDVTNAGMTHVADAVQKMQADPALTAKVQSAVVNDPAIFPILEVGGGPPAARAYDLAQQANGQPFWKTSAVFWISLLMYPAVLWYVGSTIIGGVEIPTDWPWIAQLFLKMFGTGWTGEARSGIANLVIGLILGGICGVYYGISVTQQRQQGQTVTGSETK
jgi:muramidase (phage lysozyme)